MRRSKCSASNCAGPSAGLGASQRPQWRGCAIARVRPLGWPVVSKIRPSNEGLETSINAFPFAVRSIIVLRDTWSRQRKRLWLQQLRSGCGSARPLLNRHFARPTGFDHLLTSWLYPSLLRSHYVPVIKSLGASARASSYIYV